MQQHSKYFSESVPNGSEDSFETPPVYADVAVPVHVATSFVYKLRPEMRAVAQLGARLNVPLGRKRVTGFIVGLHSDLAATPNLKESEVKDADELLDLVPLVTPELLELTKWVADYYLSPWGEVIKASLPPGITPAINDYLSISEKGETELKNGRLDVNSPGFELLRDLSQTNELRLSSLYATFGKTQAARLVRQLASNGLLHITQRGAEHSVKPKYERRVRLVQRVQNDAAAQGRKLTEAQTRVLQALESEQSISFTNLLTAANASATTVATLERRGLVETFTERLRRDPLEGASLPVVEDYILTAAQNKVLAEIEKPLRDRSYTAFLLHGVTGSGKTEVYIRAMRVALALGRSAMMLVPEIALTPVFSRRLKMHFGDQVAIFHSSLSKGERFDEWTRVKNGEARVVIGTRSAVFAPVQNLGVVIVDEEHESTYRQQDSPHYNGRDTAIVRAQKESAVVILGSATPSLESFHNASTGKYNYLQLPERLGDRPLAAAEIVDMRKVFSQHKKPRIFSDDLLAAIEETHRKGEQSIILLNRRGYSSFVLCRSCGESVQCPNCDVTLTYHRNDRVIVCHYCNHREAAPSKCPSCDGKFIYYLGEGTQQIEEKLIALFPSMRVARVDRDTTARRGTFEKTLFEFSEGKLDMLVGTQILAKGHDFPNVTLVGVVSVDAGLGLPDFRAAERTFQLLTQVAGRAGRGSLPGKVLIQTYHPYHYALRHASSQDYAGFYEEEIRHRQNHTYPPFVALASMLVHGTDLGKTRSIALELRKALDRANPDRAARILGPAPAPLARLKNEFRMQLLIKSRNRSQLRSIVDQALQEMREQKINLRGINVEIDPVSIM